MVDMWKDILLIVFGGGFIFEFIRIFKKKGCEQQIIKEHDTHLASLQHESDVLKERVYALEQSTSIRLTAIEVELKNLSADIQEISKDVKMILKRNIYGEE
jgi:hypothetical protein